ncbi:MAG: carboxypeptidase regulatory-like domain-containing protein [Acidobacteria bacterium]|nr:carboxypeptidase regulatory-like domain-containing protein [Acidobacteriota bacterium]
MRKVAGAAFVLICLTAYHNALAQSGNASVGGFVQDATKAFIPGVTVTAENTQTGVVRSATTNESGIYNIPSLLPGTYKLSAELTGFRPHIINEVQLGSNASVRYNFTLEVGGVAQGIEVTAEAALLLAESSSTIGQVLSERRVRDLPLVSNNVLDLMHTMAGVRLGASAGATLGESTTFAGISTGMVNTVRDGLSVSEGRFVNGVTGTTQVNPDMVGEFRVVLAPVDAELGRGNGQVQIITRSGTNQLRGSAVWSIRNSKLDANTWSNNKQVVKGVWTPGQPTWINRNQPAVSVGGPIIKNRTFFFVLWDQQIERQRQAVRPVVLTDCARNGIFRYWESWGNGNTLTPTSTTGLPTIASVDSFGNPVRPATNPNGTPYTGQLRYFSVFGRVTNTPARPDCSDAIVEAQAWNPLRTGMDPSGVSQKFLELMPRANIFDGGDGLNTAVHQWVRSGRNNGNFGIATGINTDTDRKTINTKIDHNINARHKVAFNYSYERIDGDYVQSVINSWPGGFTSQVIRRPKVLTLNFTSTLTAGLLNEARFGYRENNHTLWAPWEATKPPTMDPIFSRGGESLDPSKNADVEKRKIPESMLLKGGQGFPIAYIPSPVQGATNQTALNVNGFGCFTNCAQEGDTTPLWNYADTISWNKGKHSFKAGVDIRRSFTRGSETPTAPIPKATGGAGLNPNQAFSNATDFPGLLAPNQTMANSSLYFLAGSVNNVNQYYFIQSPNDLTKWLSYIDKKRKITEPHQNEFSMFFKDDWKLSPSFTLNAGLRYEYYGVPYEGQGLTIVPSGGHGGLGLFGVSGRSFDRWMRPDNGVDLNLLMQVEFVGPRTKQPDKTIYPNDWNNFGPAVGFSWQLPWFGSGKTNVRGGYQVSYVGSGHAGQLSNAIFSSTGFVNLATTQGPTDGTYFDVRNLPSFVPVPPASLPMQPVPILKQTGNTAAFDPNYVTPYIQNLTLSVTRELSRNLTLDVRYIGTRGLKLTGWLNLNTPNVFYNPALFDALDRTRRGEDALLFDQMFMGLSLNPGVAPVNGTTQRGSQHLRLSTTFRDALANGDFAAVATALNVYNGIGRGPSGAVPGVAGERGTVLRRANKGINVPGGVTVAGAPEVPAGLFPENWISANPQYNAVNYYTNSGKSNYHSMQVQGTLRPTQGISLQGTYVWSRSLETPLVGSSLGSGLQTAPIFTDPTDRDKDYALSPNHVTHDFRSFGTFDLPFGPGKLLFGNSSGWFSRLVDNWQTSVIINLSAGQPITIGAANRLYANGTADIVGSFSSRPFGSVQWDGDYGSYFGARFSQIMDPQCGLVAAELRSYCTLRAVTDAKTGDILLQNPSPGKRGTLGRQTMELPGDWRFDAAMSKTVRINETKSLQVRMDAINVFNHPTPGAPDLNINSTNPFGFIQAKGNQIRQFKGQLRFNF